MTMIRRIATRGAEQQGREHNPDGCSEETIMRNEIHPSAEDLNVPTVRGFGTG
jgi:hypothetical protein